MGEAEVTGRARGGKVRAEHLTADRRKEISQSGAAARWNPVDAEIALNSGILKIGDVSIPCAVLKDKTRVLSERAITKAFGGKRGGSHWKRLKENPDGADLPIFLSARNISPFINKELHEALSRRRIYKPRKSGGAAHGIEASLLPKICNTLLKVRDAGAAHPSQMPIIVQADIIMRGLVEVGIIALVDEATGHIDEKKKAEYRDLFREFVREECREWEKEFPEQFMDMIYRLYGLSKGIPDKHPRFFGKFIRRYVYAPLAGSSWASPLLKPISGRLLG